MKVSELATILKPASQAILAERLSVHVAVRGFVLALVIEALGEGLTQKEAAEKLGVSEAFISKTVRSSDVPVRIRGADTKKRRRRKTPDLQAMGDRTI